MDEVVHEWDVSEWPTASEEDAEDFYMDQIATYGCPFAWLLYDTNATDPALWRIANQTNYRSNYFCPHVSEAHSIA